MTGPQRRPLGDGRWFFQHGPIDCVIGADGDRVAVQRAVDAAWRRFGALLAELVDELPLLRADLSISPVTMPSGTVARRMVEACLPHAAGGDFISAMAAVAGAVAQELIGCFDDPRIRRAYVNNGGDIALCLSPGASFEIGLVANPERHGHALPLDARLRIEAASPVRGVATSGWRGRSFSLGIADSVTVLATSAAGADAAATVIANAVNVADPRIVRAPADSVRDDSDLGGRLVTRHVAPLPPALIDEALRAGAAVAERERRAGRIHAAALCLQGRVSVCGPELATSLRDARSEGYASALPNDPSQPPQEPSR